jgi:transposase
MAYIHQRGGRFLTVLPRTRGEDQAFRERLARDPAGAGWQPLWDKTDEDDQVIDCFSIHPTSLLSSEGYRVIWYHSTLKAERDALARSARMERALQALTVLQAKLQSPRTRYRTANKVWDEVHRILQEHAAEPLIEVQVTAVEKEVFRQTTLGRPTPKTKYLREVTTRFELTHQIQLDRVEQERRGDGVFPLITNDLQTSERDLLWAYKKQPVIEKRFSHLKSDFSVAPVHLHSASRIEAFLGVYFFALLVEALLERELRKALAAAKWTSLPIYPEGRPCPRPTARQVFDLFDNIQRHTLHLPGQPPMMLVTELSPAQRKILKLLGIPPETYGHDLPAE